MILRKIISNRKTIMSRKTEEKDTTVIYKKGKEWEEKHEKGRENEKDTERERNGEQETNIWLEKMKERERENHSAKPRCNIEAVHRKLQLCQMQQFFIFTF